MKQAFGREEERRSGHFGLAILFFCVLASWRGGGCVTLQRTASRFRSEVRCMKQELLKISAHAFSPSLAFDHFAC